MSLLLLSLDEVKQSITMTEAIGALERAFIQLAQQETQLPLRTGVTITSEDALMLTMPAYLSKDHALGLKVVSIFPKNLEKNKPSITGFMMLLDAHTGEPKALMDAAFLTALRTGAVSGLATKYFAKDDAHHVAIIGSGAQAKTQLAAVAAVRDIQHVSVWSRNIKNAQQFAAEAKPQFDIHAYDTIPEAIRDADIICTATNSTEPLIKLTDIKPDVHINAIGSHSPVMQEIATDVLSQAVVIVDQLEAALAEAGEIINAIAEHPLKSESIIEIGQWLIHKNHNYKNQRTVFKSVGLAIQDISVATVVYQNALHKKLGTSFILT